MEAVNVNFCIICENVRQEVNDSASILGFYGVSPHTSPIRTDPSRPITFLIGLGRPRNAFAISCRIHGPDGSLLLTGKPGRAEPRTTGAQLMVGFQFPSASFTKSGIHTFGFV